MAICTSYNQFTTIVPVNYNNGFVIGIRRETGIRRESAINEGVWGRLRVQGLPIPTLVRIERCGEYLCLIAEDADDNHPPITLSAAMREAVERVRRTCKADLVFMHEYASCKFSSEVEEKNYLQQSMVVGGETIVKMVVDSLGNDYLAAAFCKAASKHGWKSIPSAEEIFSIREKIKDRMLRTIR